MFSSFRMRKIACFPNAERPIWSILFSQYRPINTLFFLCLPEKHISLQENDSLFLTASLLRKQAFPSAAVQGNPPSPMRQTPVTLHTVINRSQNKHNSFFGHTSAFHYKVLQRSGSLFLMPHLSSSSEPDLKPEVLVYRVFRKWKNSTWFCSSLFTTPSPAMIITLATWEHYLCHLQFTKETRTQMKKERKPKNPEVGGNGNKQFWTRMMWRRQLAYVRPKLLQSVKQSDIKLIFIGFHCRLKIH